MGTVRVLFALLLLASPAYADPHFENCTLLREPPLDVPDQTITLQVPAEVERAVFEDFVGPKWQACKHHGIGGHTWKLVFTPKPLYPSPAFDMDQTLHEEFNTPDPTHSPTPTPTPALPLCSEAGPLVRCLAVQDPATILNQRVTNLEQTQTQIINVINEMRQRLPQPSATAKAKK